MVPADQVPRIDPAFLAAERRALGDAWYGQEYGCRVLGHGRRPGVQARGHRRAMLSAEVEPLFPTAPAAGDPLPLFPRGMPIPLRSPMNRFWPGA